MSKPDINKWIFEIPLVDIQENYKDEGFNTPCICCGKDLKNPKYNVHMVNDFLVSTEEPFSVNEDMGFYPIGNSCKNKLPNNFYFKNNS